MFLLLHYCFCSVVFVVVNILCVLQMCSRQSIGSVVRLRLHLLLVSLSLSLCCSHLSDDDDEKSPVDDVRADAENAKITHGVQNVAEIKSQHLNRQHTRTINHTNKCGVRCDPSSDENVKSQSDGYSSKSTLTDTTAPLLLACSEHTH